VKHYASSQFWQCYQRLPGSVRKLANKKSTPKGGGFIEASKRGQILVPLSLQALLYLHNFINRQGHHTGVI